LKICMLGAGALGSAIGGTLAAAGSEITLVDVFKPHVDAINTQGLRMRSAEGERVVRAKAAIDARDVGVVDLVIVLVKSFHTREAMQGALSLVGPGTVVMSLQNGLGHEDILADVVGKQHVIAGKTYVGGVFLSPGQVIAGVAGKETLIGELDGTITPRVQAVATEFERAGLSTVVSENIYGTMWDKLLVNVATGALAGITRLTYGDLYAVKEIEACAIAAVEEAMAVAQANGIELSTRVPRDAWVKASEGLPRDFKTSMLQSLEKGSVTEIDFINGSVVRWGARCNVPTPVNQTLVACIKGIERDLERHKERVAA
jgi:2-dehydropantoate 2-reductase